jgi:hypothetical protein
LIVASSSAALAASGWDGTWSGAWGNDPNQATSVTVAGDKVVSFSYQGYPHPVASSNVTATTITYQDQGNFVTLTKVNATTANAAMHSQGYDATAVLTRR